MTKRKSTQAKSLTSTNTKLTRMLTQHLNTERAKAGNKKVPKIK